MKKILVILLVLAVTAGVFAQGDWSVGAEAMMTSTVDFYRPTSDPTKPASVAGNGYFTPTDWWQGVFGSANIGYNRDIFSGSITLKTGEIGWHDFGNFGTVRNEGEVVGNANVDGENYFFEVESNIGQLLAPGFLSYGRLWGKYYLVNRMIKLELAFASSDPTYWVSDDTAGTGFADIGGGSNYMLGELSVGGLQAGLMLPDMFKDPSAPDGSANTIALFVDDALRKVVFGVKFEMSPLEVAAQLNMDNYGIYFGGKFFAGPITAGLSFQGTFKTSTVIKAGLSVDFNGGTFGAGVKGWLERNSDYPYVWDPVTSTGSGGNYSKIGVEPRFWIKAIPAYLAFTLDGGFFFTKADKDSDLDVSWKVVPQIFWNFTGGGAPTGYWDFGTGMIFRYRLEKDAQNALDMVFKWNMW